MSVLTADLAAGWRIAFLTLSAPVIGAVTLLAIGRLTGARWEVLGAVARPAPLLILAGAVMGLAQLAHPPPPHLVVWLAWWAVALRGALAGLLVAWAGAWLRRGASETVAGVVLAVYAVVVTPIAGDWMLGHVPGYSVSAIGMMIFVEGVAAAAATSLVMGRGSAAFRWDMAKLMVAAALGLAYLAFMDFLIVWFGNLPSRVGFHLDRSTPTMAVSVWTALVAGLAAPIAVLSLVGGDKGLRLAGVFTLAALFLFNVRWVGGGLIAALLAATAVAIAVLAFAQHRPVREGAHG